MPGYGDTDILVGCHIRENRRYLILLYRILPDALVGLHIPGYALATLVHARLR